MPPRHRAVTAIRVALTAIALVNGPASAGDPELTRQFTDTGPKSTIVLASQDGTRQYKWRVVRATT
jgi:hypothetical protein